MVAGRRLEVWSLALLRELRWHTARLGSSDANAQILHLWEFPTHIWGCDPADAWTTFGVARQSTSPTVALPNGSVARPVGGRGTVTREFSTLSGFECRRGNCLTLEPRPGPEQRLAPLHTRYREPIGAGADGAGEEALDQASGVLGLRARPAALAPVLGHGGAGMVCDGRTCRPAASRLTLTFPAGGAVHLRLPGQCQQLLPHGARRLPLQRCPPRCMTGHPRLSLPPGKRSRSANDLGAVAEWRGPHAGGRPPNCPHWPQQFNPEMPLQAARGGDTQTGSPRLGMISGCQLKLKGRRFSVPRSTCFVPPQLQTWAPPGPSGPGSLSFVAVAQPHLFHLS